MKELGEKIKKMRRSRGFTQKKLSELLDLTSDSTVSQWERGVNSPYGRDLVKLSELFNVSSDYMLGLELERSESSNYPFYPVGISAGLPNDVEAITQADKITLPDDLMGKYAGNKDIFITRVNGDSMNKIIPHNSLIAVRPVPLENLKTGDIVVYRKDSEYAVKRLIIDNDKFIFKPESTDDRFYDDVVNNEHDIVIKGKVVTYIVNLG